MDGRNDDDVHEMAWVNEVNVNETDWYKTDEMKKEDSSAPGPTMGRRTMSTVASTS